MKPPKILPAVSAAAFLMLSASYSNASDKLTFSYSPSVNFFNIQDDSANSANEVFVTPLSLGLKLPLDRTSDVKVFFDIIDTSYDSSTTEIGQTVSGYSISALWQNKYHLSRSFKPVLGIGLGFDSLELTNRERVDSDGFLVERFPDKDDTQVSVLLSTSIPLGSWPAELDAIYKHSLEEGFQGFSLRLNYYPEFIN